MHKNIVIEHTRLNLISGTRDPKGFLKMVLILVVFISSLLGQPHLLLISNTDLTLEKLFEY